MTKSEAMARAIAFCTSAHDDATSKVAALAKLLETVAAEAKEEVLKKQGIFLRGWWCHAPSKLTPNMRCDAFNGEELAERHECRRCGAPRST